MKRRFAAFAAGILMLLPAVMPSAFAEGTVRVTVDGSEVKMRTEPFFLNNILMVPARSIFEKLSYRVFYNDKTSEVIIVGGDSLTELRVGSDKAFVNGEERRLTHKALIIDDSLVVPVRFVKEVTGVFASWDDNMSYLALSHKVNIAQTAADGDDIVISENNIALNGDFELAADAADFGWSKYGNGVLSIDGDGARHGSACARVTERTTQYSGIRQDIKARLAESGKGRYKIYAYVKGTADSVGGGCVMRVKLKGSEDEKDTYKAKTAELTEEWSLVELTTELTWDGELESATFYFEGNDASKLGDYYIDVCGIEKLE